MDTLKRRFNARGFSLTEVVASLGILAGVSLPLMGVLVIGMDDTKVAWDARTLGNIRATLRLQLQDPTWPQESVRGAEWTAECVYDYRGEPVASAKGKLASIKATMVAQPGLGHQSPWLESVRVTFRASDSQETLGQCVLQRMRTPPPRQ